MGCGHRNGMGGAAALGLDHGQSFLEVFPTLVGNFRHVGPGNHHEACRRQRNCGVENVAQQAATGHLMHNLRKVGQYPRSLARSKDDQPQISHSVSPRSAYQRGATYGQQGMFSKTPPRKGSPPEVPPCAHRKGGAGPARRSPGNAAGRNLPSDPVLPEAAVALLTVSALLLALTTAGVMVRDSRSGPSTAPAPAPAPAPALVEAPTPSPAAPQATEPRFPSDQPEQPLVQDDKAAQGEQKSYPAPVAPSLDLLGPAPADMRFAVYLASFSSEEQAHAGWEILERRYRRPLSGLSPLVRRGKSGQGAHVFNLFAGPFESLHDATQRCAALSIATANCKPVDLSQTGEEAGSWN